MAYLVDADLRSRFGLETYIALFDQDGTYDRDTGVPTALMTTAVNAVIAGATARVNAWLPNSYIGKLPFGGADNPVPEIIKEAALLYAKALAYEQNPDHLNAVKAVPGMTLKDMLKTADEMAERVQDSVLRMYDAAAPTPANVGGVVYSQGPRLVIDNPDGTPNGGDF